MVARRNDNGKPICENCWRRDLRTWKPCASFGNRRRVAAVTAAGPVNATPPQIPSDTRPITYQLTANPAI